MDKIRHHFHCTPFSPFVYKLARVEVLARFKSAKCNITPFWGQQWVKGSDLAIVHAQFTCKYMLCSLLVMVVFEMLTESFLICSGGLSPLERILTNLFLSESIVTVPLWKHDFLSMT